MHFCRVCGNQTFEDPLVNFSGMPASAQGFPDKITLQADSGSDLDVVQCSSCGLVQLPGDPVPYYREVIRAVSISPEMQEFRRCQFRQLAAKYDLRGKKMLEVGCGKGEYLALMRDVGIDACGSEYAAASAEYCQKAGLQVIRGFPDKMNELLYGGPFDGFACLNFMEHWPDPNTVLRTVGRNLVEGGIGLVEVPNFDMIVNKAMFSEFIPDHLLYFTKETLSFTLQYNGFEVVESEPVWHDYILSAVVKKRMRTDLGYFMKHQQRITDQINEFVNSYPELEVAIWGAGHQALAVMALAGLAEKICYVVDSAPFKQGKFTTATHIPIEPPPELNMRPPKAVIVMAASYSEEVVGILERDYSSLIDIAVLKEDGLVQVRWMGKEM